MFLWRSSQDVPKRQGNCSNCGSCLLLLQHILFRPFKAANKPWSKMQVYSLQNCSVTSSTGVGWFCADLIIRRVCTASYRSWLMILDKLYEQERCIYRTFKVHKTVFENTIIILRPQEPFFLFSFFWPIQRNHGTHKDKTERANSPGLSAIRRILCLFSSCHLLWILSRPTWPRDSRDGRSGESSSNSRYRNSKSSILSVSSLIHRAHSFAH